MPTGQPQRTRMVFLGDAVLGEGFRLIGFEVYPDPDEEQLDRVLGELVDSGQNAYVVVDQEFGKRHCPMLERIRAEGGRIVVSGVPPLHDPNRFHCALDERIETLLGNNPATEKH
jgi:vacuolar-type H+-ATPase subunit F/Vma7